MMASIDVRRVVDRRDFAAFFRFPWTLYADDPHWTPMLLSMRRELLDKSRNPSWEYMAGDYFVAWRGDQPAGTIAVFVNHRHNDYHAENIAWFGFFECYDDQAVADALLNAALTWAREHGLSALRGPQSFTTHEECGLLVDGFARPVMLMPYNPPYYQALIENAGGFQKVMDTYSYHMDAETGRLNEAQMARVSRVVGRLSRQSNVRLRIGEKATAKQDFAIFKALYNQAWEKNWGFTPMTERELDGLVKSLAQFYDPHLACFVEVDGEAVGFLLAVPDFNQILQRAYPRPNVPELFTLLKALWHWKIRPKIDAMRLPLMGVKEAYRNKGLDILMYQHLYNVLVAADTPYKHLDCGWVLEINQPLISILAQIGMTRYRTYRFYEKPTGA